MSKDELIKLISDCCNDVVFEYNGKKSGVTSEVINGDPTFQVWHGSEIKEYDKVETLMEDKFFSDKSLSDLIDIVIFMII